MTKKILNGNLTRRTQNSIETDKVWTSKLPAPCKSMCFLHSPSYVFSVTRCSLAREADTPRSFKRKRLKRSPGTYQMLFFVFVQPVTFSHSNNWCRFSAGVGLYVHWASRAARSSGCTEMLGGWRTTSSVSMVDWWATYPHASWVRIE